MRRKEIPNKYLKTSFFTILAIMIFMALPAFADETKYTVTWDMNGGKINGENSLSVRLGPGDCLDPPQENSFTRIEAPANKCLYGWSTNKSKSGVVKFEYHYINDEVQWWFGHNYPLKEDRTYYAIWENSVAITFNAGNGGRLYDFDESGKKVYPNSITKEYAKGREIWGYPTTEATAGKAFKGWSTTTDETGLIPWVYYFKGGREYRYIASGNQTLTAIFADKVVVTWDMGEGTLTQGSEKKKTLEQEYAKGDSLNYSCFWHFPLEGPSGRKLLGWSTDGTEAGIIDLHEIWEDNDEYCTYDHDYPVLENMTLTAVWELDPATKQAKEKAQAQIKAVDPNTYVEADQEKVKNAKTTALNAIDAAKTEVEVTKAVTAFNNAIKDCTTKAEAEKAAAEKATAGNTTAGSTTTTPTATTTQPTTTTTTQPSTEAPTEVQEPITVQKTPSFVKTKVNSNKVTVSWKKIKKNKAGKKLLKQIRRVQVQIATDPEFKNIVATKQVGKKKTKAVLLLDSDTDYYVRARYVGRDGVSAWSAVKSVTTQ